MACLHHHSLSRVLGDGSDRSFPEPGVAPHYAPSRTTRITHLDLTLDLHPAARRFTGQARVAVEALPSFDGTVALDLDEVHIEGVTDADGAPLAWRHDEGSLQIRGVEAPATVVITWSGSDPRLGLYFTGPEPFDPDRLPMAWTQCQDEDAHFFLPCHDHPRSKHPWRVQLTGPLGYTLLSNGRQIESGERDGRAYAVFEQAEPMPAYLFTAVCAQLSVTSAHWREVPLRYLVPVGQEAHVERAMGRTPEMIELFSTITGVAYPWPRYDQVVVDDFVFGGMENVACTTMTDVLLVDDESAAEWDPDGLVAHELAHQWFGDLVTCQDWSQGWLNESWATFMEVVWWEHAKGAADAAWYRFNLARDYFDEDGGRYRRPIVSYAFREPVDVFDRHLYQKGACVLTTLRSMLGEDAFWSGVRTYLERHAHDTAHSRHFQRALEDVTGRNLDRFFAEWIHGAGHPELEVALAHGDGMLTVTVKQKQSGEQTPAAFAFPLRLVLVPDDGAPTTIDLPVAERERTWVLPCAAAPKTVRVDPGMRVLSSLTLKAPRGWLMALLEDPCPVLVARATRAVLEEGATQGRDAVIAALGGHPDPHVRCEIAAQLGKVGGPVVRDALIARLSVEAEPRVLRALCDALGKFREESVATALIAFLDRDVPAYARAAALLALGRTRDARARSLLEAALGTPGWADLVTRKALNGLAALRDPGVLDVMIAHTRSDHVERIRAASAGALADLAEDLPDLRDRVAERLIEMLDEKGFRALMGALDALRALRHPKALPALERIHRATADGRARRFAYEAMKAIRAGRTSEEGLTAIQRRLEALAEENATLKARVQKLEK